MWNEEFNRLVNEGMRCPTCHSNPIEIGVITICESGHYYVVVMEEE